MNQERVLAYLEQNCRGRKYTQKSHEIEAVLHMSGNELRKHINQLRRKGIPIASSRDGYFYAVTAGEIYSTIRQLMLMEKGLQYAISGLEASLDAFGGDVE